MSEQKWVSEARAWGQRDRVEDTGKGQERGLDWGSGWPSLPRWALQPLARAPPG